MANEPIDNDYSLSRVPEGAKQPLWQILMIRIGAICCVSQLVLGATLGYGMTFWGAFWATMLGSVILQVVSWALGHRGRSRRPFDELAVSLVRPRQKRFSYFGRRRCHFDGRLVRRSELRVR